MKEINFFSFVIINPGNNNTSKRGMTRSFFFSLHNERSRARSVMTQEEKKRRHISPGIWYPKLFYQLSDCSISTFDVWFHLNHHHRASLGNQEEGWLKAGGLYTTHTHAKSLCVYVYVSRLGRNIYIKYKGLLSPRCTAAAIEFSWETTTTLMLLPHLIENSLKSSCHPRLASFLFLPAKNQASHTHAQQSFLLLLLSIWWRKRERKIGL